MSGTFTMKVGGRREMRQFIANLETVARDARALAADAKRRPEVVRPRGDTPRLGLGEPCAKRGQWRGVLSARVAALARTSRADLRA